MRATAENARDAGPVSLSDLRTRAGRTQAEVANAIRTSQSGVSRIERQRDLMISTLRDFVEATGGRLRVVAAYPDYEFEVRIPALDDDAAVFRSRAFRVIWQNPSTRRLVQVGVLQYDDGGFVYSYTPEAQLDPDFVPFAAFPEFDRPYRAPALFPFFADRLAASAVGGVEQLASALGLAGDKATPVELLARSWGRTPHDTIHVVPEPVEAADGSEVMLFLASGVRHIAERRPKQTTARVARLRAGAALRLRDERDNPQNDRAIVLEAASGSVGWVPDYLLDYVHKHRDAGSTVSVAVVRANNDEVPWHLRLLCRMEIRPRDSLESA